MGAHSEVRSEKVRGLLPSNLSPNLLAPNLTVGSHLPSFQMSTRFFGSYRLRPDYLLNNLFRKDVGSRQTIASEALLPDLSTRALPASEEAC